MIKRITWCSTFALLAACSAKDTETAAETPNAGSQIETDASDTSEFGPSPAEVLAASTTDDWRTLDPENTLYVELERGRVIIALSPHLAQAHVEQIKLLARSGFYDGLSFYRVIDGFVAQGGDPFGERDIGDATEQMQPEFEEAYTGAEKPSILPDVDGYAPKTGWLSSHPIGMDDKTGTMWHLHCTGAFAYGRNNEKDTASTEIYITLQPQRYLDRNLSVAGHVVKGMEHLQALRRVSPPETREDDLGETILTMQVAADVPQNEQTPLEMLRSGTDTFDAYVESRRNRPEDFFYFRPDHMNVCALQIPVRTPAAE